MSLFKKLFQKDKSGLGNVKFGVESNFDRSNSTCKNCGKPLVYASDSKMLEWSLLNDPRFKAVAHRCERCNSRFCKSCMVERKQSCIKCGGKVVNAREIHANRAHVGSFQPFSILAKGR